MIIGEISNGMTIERNGKFARLKPSAASVPSAVAINVAAAPMPMLLTNARCQSCPPHTCPYPLTEKPSIGYEKYEPELNDSGMIAMIGATRKKKMIAQWIRRPV